MPATLKTTISKQPFFYFRVKLVTKSDIVLEPLQYYSYIRIVLKQWLGVVGSGMTIDILDMTYPEAAIRVPYDNHKQAWQAMTLNSFRLTDDTLARFQVLQTSAFAMGIIDGSR